MASGCHIGLQRSDVKDKRAGSTQKSHVGVNCSGGGRVAVLAKYSSPSPLVGHPVIVRLMVVEDGPACLASCRLALIKSTI